MAEAVIIFRFVDLAEIMVALGFTVTQKYEDPPGFFIFISGDINSWYVSEGL